MALAPQPPEHPTRRLLKPVGSCLGGCASVGMVFAGAVVAGVFLVRDVVSTYLPGPARAVGLHWFAAQPRPTPAEACLPEVCCTLTWRRNGLSSAWYRVECEASAPVRLSSIALSSEDLSSGWVYEDQRPLSGQEIELGSGRRWHYDGTLDIGTGGVMPGSVSRRSVQATLRAEGPGEPGELQLIAAEPLR